MHLNGKPAKEPVHVTDMHSYRVFKSYGKTELTFLVGGVQIIIALLGVEVPNPLEVLSLARTKKLSPSGVLPGLG